MGKKVEIEKLFQIGKLPLDKYLDKFKNVPKELKVKVKK